jgi:uncharacterized protein (DUF2235 family)
MRRDIGEAYTFLMNAWEPGDKVFIFGFSRGAYTARALCGMLYRVGLMRPASENLIPYALRVYARRPGRDSDLSAPNGWGLMDRFAGGLSRRIEWAARERLSFPIEFLGLFDTVKGTGIIGRDITWPYTNQLPNVARIVHAVSIDENRRPFRECLVRRQLRPEAWAWRHILYRRRWTGGPTDDYRDDIRVSEVWFAGIHSDIGGGFHNDPGLGRISMRWVLDAAITAGLIVRPQRYNNLYTLAESDACQPMHGNDRKWALAGYKRRRIPLFARVHASVRTRMMDPRSNYHPLNLHWVDDWEGGEQWWGAPDS